MRDLVGHVLFLLPLLGVIVTMSAFYAEAEDGPALRSVPRRFLVYLGSCAAVSVVMLLCEALFASV